MIAVRHAALHDDAGDVLLAGWWAECQGMCVAVGKSGRVDKVAGALPLAAMGPFVSQAGIGMLHKAF